MLDGKVINESFIFHSDYIETLPVDVTPLWTSYICNYGFCGIEPVFKDWRDSELWRRIKNRIDADKAAYAKKVEYQKAYYEQKKAKKNNSNNSSFSNFSSIENIENFDLDTRRDTDSVSEYVSDTVSVSDTYTDSVSESEYVSEKNKTLSLPQENYSKEIYKLWTDAKLPIEKDIFQFQCGGFKTALSSLSGINSKDVIQACRNYIKELRKTTSYITNEYRFERFVSIPSFKDFLPGFYRAKNFQLKGNGNNPVIQSDAEQPWEKEGVSSKEFYGVKTMEDVVNDWNKEQQNKAVNQ